MTFFFVAGLLYSLSAHSLAVAAFVGLWFSPMPVWLGRSMIVLSVILLGTGAVIGFAYVRELFIAYYSATVYERAAFHARATGSYAWAYWSVVVAALVPQLFWVRRFRSRPLPAFLIALGAVLPSAIERVYAATR